MNERMRFNLAEASAAGQAYQEIPAFRQPMWTPWVINQDGRSVKLGSAMTKREAWEVARIEFDRRSDAAAMAVRLDGVKLL